MASRSGLMWGMMSVHSVPMAIAGVDQVRNPAAFELVIGAGLSLSHAK
jgi:hypothetical protein